MTDFNLVEWGRELAAQEPAWYHRSKALVLLCDRVEELEVAALTSKEAQWLLTEWPDGAYDKDIIAKVAMIAAKNGHSNG